MTKSRYIIFNYDGDYFEFVTNDVLEAIDEYAKKLDYSLMNLHYESWNKIKTALPEYEERVKLLNELAGSVDRGNRIERIIGNYTYLYGDVITPVEE